MKRQNVDFINNNNITYDTRRGTNMTHKIQAHGGELVNRAYNR